MHGPQQAAISALTHLRAPHPNLNLHPRLPATRAPPHARCPPPLPVQVPRLLAAAGVNKINFVGGEPFLHPHIEDLVVAAKAAGLVTSVVTNASLLDAARLLRLRGRRGAARRDR